VHGAPARIEPLDGTRGKEARGHGFDADGLALSTRKVRRNRTAMRHTVSATSIGISELFFKISDADTEGTRETTAL